MKDIAKAYPLLTADERFRLFIEAIGRKDLQEADRLDKACPRKSYTIEDCEYTHRKVRFMLLALTTALDLAKLESLCNLAILVGVSTEEYDDETAEKAFGAFEKLMDLREGKRAGWQKFCEHIGTNPGAISDHLGTKNSTAMELAEGIAEHLGAQEADPKIAEREFAALREIWSH